MNKRKLGRTDLHLSELCLSTAKFGWINDETTSLALLDAYYTCGGSFIQSAAAATSSKVADGMDTRSEEIVARWRETRAISRNTLTLAVRLSLSRPSHGGSIALSNLVREACEASLRRLRTGNLDLLICEWDDDLVPVDDVNEALSMLIRAGLVRYAVAGNFPAWRIVDSLHRASLRNHARFEAVQTEYSLMTRARFEDEVLSLCREHRIGFLARSPLAGGFLANRPIPTLGLMRTDSSWVSERFGCDRGDTVLQAINDVARKRLASPAQIALAWVLRNPQVTSAVVSPMNADEMRELARTTRIALSDAEATALTRITSVQDYRMELRHV